MLTLTHYVACGILGLTKSKFLSVMIHEFAKTQTAVRHPYLEGQRHIEQRVLSDSRFVGLVRKDTRGNAVFPHFDKDGEISGYEMKNRSFTGFSPEGEKGVWQSRNLKTAEEIVITESAIDALSHAQLKGTGPETAYVSVGGSMSKLQEDQIRQIIIAAGQRGIRVNIATDNDAPGHKLGRRLRDMAPEGTDIRRTIPAEGVNDWNKLLENRERQWGIETERDQGPSLGC